MPTIHRTPAIARISTAAPIPIVANRGNRAGSRAESPPSSPAWVSTIKVAASKIAASGNRTRGVKGKLALSRPRESDLKEVAGHEFPVVAQKRCMAQSAPSTIATTAPARLLAGNLINCLVIVMVPPAAGPLARIGLLEGRGASSGGRSRDLSHTGLCAISRHGVSVGRAGPEQIQRAGLPHWAPTLDA